MKLKLYKNKQRSDEFSFLPSGKIFSLLPNAFKHDESQNFQIDKMTRMERAVTRCWTLKDVSGEVNQYFD